MPGPCFPPTFQYARWLEKYWLADKETATQYISMRMAKTEKQNKAKCWQRCRETTVLITAGGNSEQHNRRGKTVWQLLKKLDVHLPYEPVIFLGTHPREMKTCVHPKTCTWMFTAALFIIAKFWKQPKSFTGKWQTVVGPHNRILLSNKKGTNYW